MKKNFPVTGIEHDYPTSFSIVSTTDRKGVITHTNDEFVQTSGFTADELLGKSHNIVRHPDMPPAAFQDLWDTLKRNEPWLGVVKNRCKNGDHYWVEAFVAPMYEGNQITGYQSVRFKPEREHIHRAEKLYQRINAGKLSAGFFNGVSFRSKLFFGAALPIVSVMGFLNATLPSTYATTLLAGLLLTLAAVFGLITWLTRDLRFAAAEAERTFSNPIARYIFSGRHDEVGSVILAARLQKSRIRTLLGRAKDVSDDLLVSAQRTATAVEETNSALEMQRAEVEQIATAITEMAASVEEVARSTVATAAAADDANKRSTRIGEVADETVHSISSLEAYVHNACETLARLEESSKNISNVITVIREIADQTNLLALNAAIEAARAGETGRGFAVVADEVRRLSLRTAEATEEIQSMIRSLQQSTQQTVSVMHEAEAGANDSVGRVKTAMNSLSEIVEAITTIDDMAAQIATASEQQSAVAREISESIQKINSTADRTANSAGQAAHMSDTLLKVAGKLQSVVKQCA